MELNRDSDHHVMIEESSPKSIQIDPRRARFPYCIVWSPLPVISWFIPFIGHVGICREDGVILDFAGPNFVCVDNFTFGAATRYLQISKEKVGSLFDCEVFKSMNKARLLLHALFTCSPQCSFLPCTSDYNNEDQNQEDEFRRDTLTWDEALRKSTQDFQHHHYNLFTCNCHSFVANNLNRLGFRSGGWNVVNLAILFLLEGSWVNKAAILRSVLPFVIIFLLGLIFGGSTFLTIWASVTFLLVGWFFLGTYCFPNMIQL